MPVEQVLIAVEEPVLPRWWCLKITYIARCSTSIKGAGGLGGEALFNHAPCQNQSPFLSDGTPTNNYPMPRGDGGGGLFNALMLSQSFLFEVTFSYLGLSPMSCYRLDFKPFQEAVYMYTYMTEELRFIKC